MARRSVYAACTSFQCNVLTGDNQRFTVQERMLANHSFQFRTFPLAQYLWSFFDAAVRHEAVEHFFCHYIFFFAEL